MSDRLARHWHVIAANTAATFCCCVGRNLSPVQLSQLPPFSWALCVWSLYNCFLVWSLLPVILMEHLCPQGSTGSVCILALTYAIAVYLCVIIISVFCAICQHILSVFVRGHSSIEQLRPGCFPIIAPKRILILSYYSFHCHVSTLELVVFGIGP